MGMCPAKLDQFKHLPYLHHILIDIWFSRQFGDTNLKGADYGLSTAQWRNAGGARGSNSRTGSLCQGLPSAESCGDISKAAQWSCAVKPEQWWFSTESPSFLSQFLKGSIWIRLPILIETLQRQGSWYKSRTHQKTYTPANNFKLTAKLKSSEDKGQVSQREILLG